MPGQAELILMKSVASDQRYLVENLSILDPRKGSVGVTYRRVWFEPRLLDGLDGLKGKRALVVLFDFTSGLLEPVREAEVSEVVRTGDSLRLALSLGKFVKMAGRVSIDDIPRLGSEGFDSREPAPPDRRGRHAFVFEPPGAWKKTLSSLVYRSDAKSWFDLMGDLGSPESSPYRSCRTLWMSPVSDGVRLPSGAHLFGWNASKPASVRVFGFDGKLPPQEPLRVCLLAHTAGRAYWKSTAIDVPNRGWHDSLIPSPGPDSLGDEHHVQIEAVTTDGKCDRQGHLEFEIVGTTGPLGQERTLEQESEWVAVLKHLTPQSDAQRVLCRQLLSGIRSHGKLEPGIVDLLLDWQMYEDAALVVRDIPGLLNAASDRELGGWLIRMTDALPQEQVAMVRHALTRLSANTSASELLLSYVGFLEGQPTASAFWKVVPVWELWVEARRKVEEMPLVQALILDTEADARFGALLEKWSLEVPRSAAEAMLAIAYGLLGDDRAREIELGLLQGGLRRVDAARLIRGGKSEALRAMLADLPSNESTFQSVSEWYWKNVVGCERQIGSLAADVSLWLWSTARALSADHAAVWQVEVARLAVEMEDWVLLLAAGRDLNALPDELKGRVEDALERAGTLPSAELTQRIRERLKGKRVLVLGGQYPVGWLQPLESAFGLKVTLKNKEKSSAFGAGDIPDGVDYCVVLKWAGHEASRCARDRLGGHKVDFVPSPGFRSVSEVLTRWAATLPDEDV